MGMRSASRRSRITSWRGRERRGEFAADKVKRADDESASTVAAKQAARWKANTHCNIHFIVAFLKVVVV